MDSVSVNLLKIDVFISTGQLVMEQCCMDLLKHATNYLNGHDRINKIHFEGLRATSEQLSEACTLMNQLNIPGVSKATRVNKIEEMKMNIDYMIETYSRSINSISTLLAEKNRLLEDEKNNLVLLSEMKKKNYELLEKHDDVVKENLNVLSRYGEMAEELANKDYGEEKDKKINELTAFIQVQKHEIEILCDSLEKETSAKQKQTDISNSQTLGLETKMKK